MTIPLLVTNMAVYYPTVVVKIGVPAQMWGSINTFTVIDEILQQCIIPLSSMAKTTYLKYDTTKHSASVTLNNVMIIWSQDGLWQLTCEWCVLKGYQLCSNTFGYNQRWSKRPLPRSWICSHRKLIKYIQLHFMLIFVLSCINSQLLPHKYLMAGMP